MIYRQEGVKGLVLCFFQDSDSTHLHPKYIHTTFKYIWNWNLEYYCTYSASHLISSHLDRRVKPPSHSFGLQTVRTETVFSKSIDRPFPVTPFHPSLSSIQPIHYSSRFFLLHLVSRLNPLSSHLSRLTSLLHTPLSTTQQSW